MCLISRIRFVDRYFKHAEVGSEVPISTGVWDKGVLGDGIGEFEDLGFREILCLRKIDMLVITG